jgi:hypothetical protein
MSSLSRPRGRLAAALFPPGIVRLSLLVKGWRLSLCEYKRLWWAGAAHEER